MKAAAQKTKKRSAPKPASKLKTSVNCGTSVDGFIARLDDTFDFLELGGGIPPNFKDFFDSVDVVVMGRRTFEVVAKLGHFALYGKKRVVVLSTRPLDFSAIKGAKLERMSGTPAKIVAQLQARGFRHAYVDGGVTIQNFLRAGLVDKITVTRVPVLIGQGIPLFGAVPKDVRLRHVATRSFPGGNSQSEYEVIKR
jgi:dihydrofolate reductase